MKRAVLAGIGVLLIAGVVLLWWVGRDTPEKALRDAVKKLVTATSIGQLSLDVSWSDSATRVTTGWSAVGQVDLKDIARPQALGVIRASQGTMGPTEQVADAILTDSRIALRPRDVNPDLRRFTTFLRDPFLDGKGFASLIAQQPSLEIRKVLPSAVGVLRAVSWENVLGTGDVTVLATTDAASLQPFMVALATAWIGDNPTPDELTWIGRTTAGLAKGTIRITLNRRTREPSLIEAEWPLLGEDSLETRRMHVRARFSGLNMPVTIAIPAEADEVTDDEGQVKQGGASLPAAALKTLPSSASMPGMEQAMESGITATGTYATTVRQFIDEKGTDLFHKYMEELRRSEGGS
ncbi:MAG: hypothetical protein V1745_02300 [Patescibacteria group bacterium]